MADSDHKRDSGESAEKHNIGDNVAPDIVINTLLTLGQYYNVVCHYIDNASLINSFNYWSICIGNILSWKVVYYNIAEFQSRYSYNFGNTICIQENSSIE